MGVRSAEAPDAVVLRRATSDGLHPVTAAAFAAEVTATAKGPIAHGLPRAAGSP